MGGAMVESIEISGYSGGVTSFWVQLAKIVTPTIRTSIRQELVILCFLDLFITNPLQSDKILLYTGPVL
jgi:hypothetical protein